MAMKETEGSLRAYFFLAGAMALLLSLRDIGEAHELAGDAFPVSWMLAIWFPIIARLVLGAGFLLAGLTLKSALPKGATWIKQLLLGSVAVQVIDGVLSAGVLGTDLGRPGLISALIGLAVTAYLIASVKRLSAEAMARTVAPARIA